MRRGLLAFSLVVTTFCAVRPARGDSNIRTLRADVATAFGKASQFRWLNEEPGPFRQLELSTTSPCTFDVRYQRADGAADAKIGSWGAQFEQGHIDEADPKVLHMDSGSIGWVLLFPKPEDAAAALAAEKALVAHCVRADLARTFLKTNLNNDLTAFNVVRPDGLLYGETVKVADIFASMDCEIDLKSRDESRTVDIDLRTAIEVRPFRRTSDTDTSLFIGGPFRTRDDGESMKGQGVQIDAGARPMMHRMINAVEFLMNHCNPPEPGGF